MDGDKKDGLVVCVKSLTTGEQVQFSVLEIFKPSDRKKLTIIARTLQELQFEIAAASQTVELSDTKAVLPEKLLGKANKIIETVEQIPKKIRNGSKSSFCSWEWS